jgi:hypothetical protein
MSLIRFFHKMHDLLGILQHLGNLLFGSWPKFTGFIDCLHLIALSLELVEAKPQLFKAQLGAFK